MIVVVIKLKEGFTLADVAQECQTVFGTGNAASSDVHQFLPASNTGIDPWAQGGYISAMMPEAYAKAFEAALTAQEPTTCQLVRVEWPGQEYEPITFINSDGVAQPICVFS